MIRVLVEGKGDRKAGPQLVRRLLQHHFNEYAISVESEATGTSGKGGLIERFEQLIRLLCGNQPCQGIVVFVDSDHDNPVELASQLATRAQTISTVSVAVICPVEEFENWFICSLDSICPARMVEIDCEHVNNSKRILDECLPQGYRSTLHRADLVWKIDLEKTFQRSSSFQRLGEAIGVLVESIHTGAKIFSPSAS